MTDEPMDKIIIRNATEKYLSLIGYMGVVASQMKNGSEKRKQVKQAIGEINTAIRLFIDAVTEENNNDD